VTRRREVFVRVGSRKLVSEVVGGEEAPAGRRVEGEMKVSSGSSRLLMNSDDDKTYDSDREGTEAKKLFHRK